MLFFSIFILFGILALSEMFFTGKETILNGDSQLFGYLSIYESYFRKYHHKIFFISFGLVSLLAIFRYGVGTDYFSFLFLYNQVPALTNVGISTFWATIQNIHGELGFLFTIGILRSFDIGYIFYVMTLTAIMMYGLYHFIQKHTTSKLLALFIFYCMYYFTYITNAQRQGFVLIIFMFILLDLLLQKKYILYVIIVVVCSLFHTSILVVLILPFLNNKFKKYFLITGYLFAITNFIGTIFIGADFITTVIGISNAYGVSGISILGILSRSIMLGIILSLMFLTKEDKRTIFLKNILIYYFAGFAIYIAFANIPIMASRLFVYFQILEIIIISHLLFKLHSKWRKMFVLILVLLIMPIFYWNNINAELIQGGYFNVSSILNYPYTHIFNPRRIREYRSISNYSRQFIWWWYQ